LSALGVVTGDVGAGKTVAVRAAVSALDPTRHQVIYTANPASGARGLYVTIVRALGERPRYLKAELMAQAGDLLAAEAASTARSATHRDYLFPSRYMCSTLTASKGLRNVGGRSKTGYVLATTLVASRRDPATVPARCRCRQARSWLMPPTARPPMRPLLLRVTQRRPCRAVQLFLARAWRRPPQMVAPMVRQGHTRCHGSVADVRG